MPGMPSFSSSSISNSNRTVDDDRENCSTEPFLNNNLDNGELPFPLLVFFAVPATTIILLTVFGNLLVLCFKAKVGRTNTTLLVWNLGLTDFLVGLVVLPMGAVHLITRKWIFGRILCRIWVAADVTFCTCSVVTICVISVDRYLAVTRPLRYKSVVTKLKVISVIVITWSFSSAILLTTVRWDQSDCVDDSVCFAGNEIRYLAHSVVFAFFLPASVTLTLYWRIYKLARNRQKALDRGFFMILGHNMNFLTNTLSQQDMLRVHYGQDGMVEHQRRVLRTHERIAKTLGVVSCSFLFCWLPFFSLYLANYQCSGCVPTLAIDVASWLGYCNSMLNPIIYSFTVKEFKRSALRAVLPAWRFAFHCLPVKILPKPPERVARMSRNGNRARGRRTNDALKPKLSRPIGTSTAFTTSRATQRRVTEPAVFAGGKIKVAGEKDRQKKEDFDLRHTIAEEPRNYSDEEEKSSDETEHSDPLVSYGEALLVKSMSAEEESISLFAGCDLVTTSSNGAVLNRNGSVNTPMTIPVCRASQKRRSTGRMTPLALASFLDRTKRARRRVDELIDESSGASTPNGATSPSHSLTDSWNSLKLTARTRARRWAFTQRLTQSMDPATGVMHRMLKSTSSSNTKQCYIPEENTQIQETPLLHYNHGKNVDTIRTRPDNLIHQLPFQQRLLSTSPSAEGFCSSSPDTEASTIRHSEGTCPCSFKVMVSNCCEFSCECDHERCKCTSATDTCTLSSALSLREGQFRRITSSPSTCRAGPSIHTSASHSPSSSYMETLCEAGAANEEEDGAETTLLHQEEDSSSVNALANRMANREPRRTSAEDVRLYYVTRGEDV